LLLNLSTARDVFGTLRAVAAFPAVLLAPGYCLAWATNLLDFRGRSLGERLAWGVVVSFAGMPLLAVEVGKYVSLSIVCWLCGLCTACLIAIVVSRGRTSDLRRYRTSGWIALAWLAFVVLELVDIGVGAHLYLSVTVFDNALRTSFVDATLRSGVPPVNPLYWPGHAAPMRYYYFWYVLTALAARSWTRIRPGVVLQAFSATTGGCRRVTGDPPSPMAQGWDCVGTACRDRARYHPGYGDGCCRHAG
jgi:hypothetical protein